jgi:hypothetical protein
MAKWDKDWADLSEKPLGVIQDRKYKAYAGRDDVLSAMSGLALGTKSQASCDPADSPRGSKSTKEDNMELRNEKFSKNIAPFKRDIGKMVAALKKMLAATDKAKEPELYRNIKLLMTGAEAFLARMEQHAQTWAKNAKDTKSYDKVQEVEDPAERKKASEARALALELRDLKKKLNATLKKALLAVQTIKSGLTKTGKDQAETDKLVIDAYNDAIDKGGRDLYMTLVAIRTVKADSKLGKTSEAKKIPDPAGYVDQLKQFGESAGAYRRFGDKNTAKDVQAAVKIFNTTVKDVAIYYSNFLKA